jgi:hypothetical protein
MAELWQKKGISENWHNYGISMAFEWQISGISMEF